nr:bifunctional UDP-N-acetylglucosamine diphosphorylase/glucosamine-1-phosphate N-acetyltransferase GlmU [Actinomycetota bacterium]
AVVMAAGLGRRMRSATPKHLHPLLGRRVVDWVLEAARPLGASPLVAVVSPGAVEAFAGIDVVVQERPLGTGDAVRTARPALEGRARDVLVLSGDAPLLTPDLLRDLVDVHRAEGAAATVLSFEPEEPRDYGRVVRDAGGKLRAIVEARDAGPDELAVREVNSSIYAFRAERLWPVLERLEAVNAQGELYLTDAVRHLVDGGESVAVHVADDPRELEGVNTRVELAAAAAALRERVNTRHMLAGVTIVDPATTWIDGDVELEPDTVVHPFTQLRGRTRIAAGAEIGPHAVVVDAHVGEGVPVGPFCYLRPGTVLEAGAKAGTFVEIKNSRVRARAKVPHLSYVGDADIGEATNVAAGNITANFSHEPGRPKGRTTIGRNVRTGVDNTFVAPVDVGDDAWIAPGAVITEDVPPGSLAGFAPRQVTKEGYVYRKHGKRDD